MDGQPMRLRLEPLFGLRKQVEVWQETPGDAGGGVRRELLATIELNAGITLVGGTRYSIRPVGSRWSQNRALWRSDAPAPGEAPLATFRRERVGALRWRSVLRNGDDPGTVYLLRRRSGWGAPANVDVVPLPAKGQDPQTAGPVLLRVERVGRVKRSLQADVVDAAALTLPIVLFVLNVLAMQERAAAASSAG